MGFTGSSFHGARSWARHLATSRGVLESFSCVRLTVTELCVVRRSEPLLRSGDFRMWRCIWLLMGHRLSPPPERPWLMRMRWCDLLFAHWVGDAALVRSLIPQQLELDLFDGRAYLGAVPFRMEGVAPRLLPNLPGFHSLARGVGKGAAALVPASARSGLGERRALRTQIDFQLAAILAEQPPPEPTAS